MGIYGWIGLIASLITIVTPAYFVGRYYYRRHLKWKMLHKELAELSDKLGDAVFSFFNTLLKIRLSPDEAINFRLAVPCSPDLKVSQLSKVRHELDGRLSVRQEKALNAVENSAIEAASQLEEFENQVKQLETYCIMSLKNGIKLAAYSATIANQMISKLSSPTIEPLINSNGSIEPYLLSLGFSHEEISNSRVLETGFTADKRYWEI